MTTFLIIFGLMLIALAMVSFYALLKNKEYGAGVIISLVILIAVGIFGSMTSFIVAGKSMEQHEQQKIELQQKYNISDNDLEVLKK